MKMNLLSKCGVLAALSMLVFASQSDAVDIAEAAGVMSEMEAMSVSAKASLASAALGGDMEAIAEAKKRSDAIDAAVAGARDAFARLESNVKNGDNDAAETAEDDLAAALVQVRDALMGAIPEDLLATAEGSTTTQKSGGSPGDPDDPPNIHEVPWKSEGIKAYYQQLFGEWWNASAFGHGGGFGDGDATPE
jgi:hypothetical protein